MIAVNCIDLYKEHWNWLCAKTDKIETILNKRPFSGQWTPKNGGIEAIWTAPFLGKESQNPREAVL